MRISLELVPRTVCSLESNLSCAAQFNLIESINIPDLSRFSLRSWEAAAHLHQLKPALRFIVHIRAQDFALDQPFALMPVLRSLQIEEILVIAGDTGKTQSPYQTQTVPFVKKLRQEAPELKIYTAFDPYRSNIRYELEYLKEKEEAGSCGFFSQPFFDIRLLELYAEYLEYKTVFWGVAPVLSESSRQYWEARNRAIFPKKFRADLVWNTQFCHQVMQFCTTGNFHLYLMPIKVDLALYLQSILGKSAFSLTSED
ncbi:MAG: methylenetetrahydrofolate reductase [Spirochaetaceae bacterium]|jgi:methylenetetrahydrofolate reductase (NADPH)|nr:methylenetetrahydrofolate reductase [Spirochaetaceae bacterium]